MKKYEEINIGEYIRSGEGGTAVSYQHKTRNTLAKLYNPGFEADRAVAEFLTARTVYEMGISTPEPYRLVTDGERYGAEYEFIPGKRSPGPPAPFHQSRHFAPALLQVGYEEVLSGEEHGS